MQRFPLSWNEVVRIDAIAALVALTGVVWWLVEIPQRHAEAVNSAWQAVNSANGERDANGGGRIDALERLLREGISLKGLVVSHAYLDGVDLSRGDLVTSNFTRARLADAKFDFALLDYAAFNGARLQQARFTGSKGRYASFERAFLNRADFTSSPYLACDGAGAPAPAATPVANLGPEDFDARLDGPVAYGASEYVDMAMPATLTNLYGASFSSSSLHTTQFCGSYLYQAKFDGADASAANFSNAAARYASFRGVVLESADFSGADLVHADFSGACLLGADFTGANLGGATFEGARFGLDPNYRKTRFDGAQMDDELRSFARELVDLSASPIQPLYPSAVVAYEVVPYHSAFVRHQLKEKRLRLEHDPAEGPPSCPPPADQVLPNAKYGEY